MKEKMTIKECLRHYLNEKDPQDLASFCGTKPRYVSKWDKNIPKGLGLVKSIAFLATKEGYGIADYNSDDLELKAILAIGYNYTTISEMASYLGFAHDYDLYRFLFKKRSMSEEKKSFLQEFLSSTGQDLKSLTNHRQVEFKGSSFISDFKALTKLLLKIESDLDLFIVSSSEIRRELRAKLEENGLSFFKSSNSLYRVLDKMNALCSEKSKTVKNY